MGTESLPPGGGIWDLWRNHGQYGSTFFFFESLGAIICQLTHTDMHNYHGITQLPHSSVQLQASK